MRLHRLLGEPVSLKTFERWQRRESHFGSAKFRKRMRELCTRSDRKLRANISKILARLP